MLQRLFAAFLHFPSYAESPPDFSYIFWLLRDTSRYSMSALSLKVVREVVFQRISMVPRKRKSISLALAIAQRAVSWDWDHFDLGERPYVTLDKVMLEIWSEQEVVEGRSEENLLQWQDIRSKVKEKYGTDLATLNGHLPTWNASAARNEPSKLGRFLSVFGLDWVCVSSISISLAAHSYQPFRI